MADCFEPMKPIIEIVTGQMRASLEGEVFRAVQNVGVNVDKDRLLQALNDARSFYAEGFRAGQKSVEAEPVKHGRWHEKCVAGFNKAFCTIFVCSECKKRYSVPNMNYCPNCGAKMDLE